jgi:hypothetical protein
VILLLGFTPIGAKFLCNKQYKMHKIVLFHFLFSPASLASLFAPRQASVILKAVGTAPDPVHGDDKVLANEEAVVVAVTPVLAHHTRPAGKHSTCSGWSMPKTPPKDPSHAHLSNGVYLTTQAWLQDCHPRD